MSDKEEYRRGQGGNEMQPPVTLPLTTAAFAAALRAGHGRAIQQLENYGSSGLEDLIVEACVTCVSYDPQCEAERAPWLFSLVDRAKLNARVVHSIEHSQFSENHRDMDQRSALLKELAAFGSENARRLLYLSLARMPGSASVIGANEIIALDGLEGLIYVARQQGRWLQADPDFSVDDDLITQLNESLGTEVGLSALEREAARDSGIESYLAGVLKNRDRRGERSARFDPTAFTAIEIVAHVEKKPKEQCHWFRRWGMQANNDERETVFAALLASHEPEHVKRFFRCFARIGVPRFESRLLRWLDHPDEHLQWAAVTALSPISHPELRQAAKRLIRGGDMANGVALLVSNFAEGDFSLCEEHLPRLEDADETHRIVRELLTLCEAHPGDDALDSLLYVYECSPCSTCRKHAVKALVETNTAPTWVLAECAFDAEPDTRSLVREYGKGQA